MLGWTCNATEIFNLALHPIVVTVKFQVVIVVLFLALTCWVVKKINLLQMQKLTTPVRSLLSLK